MDWQPIETAPKDGTEVLVTGFLNNNPDKGRWTAVATHEGSWWMDNLEVLHTPTHWMPLPEPPTVG